MNIPKPSQRFLIWRRFFWYKFMDIVFLVYQVRPSKQQGLTTFSELYIVYLIYFPRYHSNIKFLPQSLYKFKCVWMCIWKLILIHKEWGRINVIINAVDNTICVTRFYLVCWTLCDNSITKSWSLTYFMPVVSSYTF